MIKEPEIQIYDLIMSLSAAVDLVSPAVANHHLKVAFIAYILGKEMKLQSEDLNQLVIAGALHDLGALSLRERLDFLEFDVKNPHKHAELGYLLLSTFRPMHGVADLVRHHHVPWNGGSGESFNGIAVNIGSHLLHLADRISVLISEEADILSQRDRIKQHISAFSGKFFHPELVELFFRVAEREYFWIEAAKPEKDGIIYTGIRKTSAVLDRKGLLEFAKFFARIIDFRSRHTATHSSGVATVAAEIGRLAGFSENECTHIKIAGYFHDLGKLSVPVEILDKTEPLSDIEFNIIKKHPYYTYLLINKVGVSDNILYWSSYHHETLSSDGYPFRLPEAELPLGSRILAVADIFTALTEDRPYRLGMPGDEALKILSALGKERKIDHYAVSLLEENFKDINIIRMVAQEQALKEYREIGI